MHACEIIVENYLRKCFNSKKNSSFVREIGIKCNPCGMLAQN